MPNTPLWEPKQLQPWHHRVVDLLIADPTLTNEQLSAMLNCNIGAAMISLLRRTEMFRLSLEERRQQVSRAVDTVTAEQLTGKLHKLAAVALDTVGESLARERATEPVGVSNGALETCEMVLKSLGYGRPLAAAQHTQVVQLAVNVDASDIAAAQHKMRLAHARPTASEPAEGRSLIPGPVAVRAG